MKLPLPLLESIDKVANIHHDELEEAHQQSRRLSLRLNSRKMDVERIKTSFPLGHSVPWAKNAFYLDLENYYFSNDLLWHLGAYYVQESSSMFLDFVLDYLSSLNSKDESKKMLDFCAAPGGKSTILYDHLRQNDILICNEAVQKRIASLYENSVKWGMKNVGIGRMQVERISPSLDNTFDLVLADVPCSGSGLFRKKKEYVHEWSFHLVEQCVIRQRKIVKSIAHLVKEGGFFIYSTCSFSSEENEEIVDAMMQTGEWQSLRLEVPQEWKIVMTESEKHRAVGYRFFPHLSGGEGFYLAVLQKRETNQNKKNDAHDFKSHKGKKDKSTQSLLNIIKPEKLKFENQSFSNFIGEGLRVFEKDGQVFCLSDVCAKFLNDFHRDMGLQKISGHLGKLNKDLFIPSHDFALFISPEKMNDTALYLDVEEATAIMSGKEILNVEKFQKLNDHLIWHLVKYQGCPLAWIKKSKDGNLKNYYPSNWALKV